MSDATVRIRFTGSKVVKRIIGKYVWEAANDHVTDVDLDTAADLLTSPENDWALAEKPKPAVHRELAERMGLAPKELIVVGLDEGEEPVAGPITLAYQAPEEPAEGEVKNG